MEEAERTILQKARRGDREAFRELVRLHGGRIHAIAYRITGSSEDAQDVAQEVFVRLHGSLDRYDGRFLFTTWLYRVAVNIAIDHRRRAARHRHEPIASADCEPAVHYGAPPPDALIECGELAGAVEKLAAGLSEQQRRVFVLRDLQEFTTAEIASILDCRESTVRVHLARAREHMRKAIAETYPEYLGGDRK